MIKTNGNDSNDNRKSGIASVGNGGNDSGSGNRNGGNDSGGGNGSGKRNLRTKIKDRIRSGKSGNRSDDSKSLDEIGFNGGIAEQNSGDSGQSGRGSRRGRKRIANADNNRNEYSADNGNSGNDGKQEEKSNRKNSIRLDEFADAEPKKARPRSKGKTSKIDSVALLAETIAIPFWTMGLLLQEPHWVLQEEEKRYLGESLDRFIDSMPKSRINKIQKTLDKYLPTVQLAFAFGVITYPRFTHSKIYGKLTGASETEGTVETETAQGDLPVN